MSEFTKELTDLLNKHIKEDGANVPDFVLAEYLKGCLKAFNKATKLRDRWYKLKLESPFMTRKLRE